MTIVSKISKRIANPKQILLDCKYIVNLLKRPDVVILNGVKIPIGDHQSSVVKRYLYDGTYEKFEAELLKIKLSKDDVIVELGGGLGYMAALSCKTVKDNNVYVYEANPSLKSTLLDMFKLNGIKPKLNMYALGAQDGEMDFFIHKDFWGSSSVDDGGKSNAGSVTVPVVSFEKEISKLDKKPNFLICDIEGGEYDLFTKGDLGGVKKILCEVHPQILGMKKIQEMQKALKKKGYKIDEAVSRDDVWYLEL